MQDAPGEVARVGVGRFEVTVNGRRMSAEGLAPETTLLDWLRASGLTGAKQGCGEGDCGACTVAVIDRDAHGRPCYRAINSCIALAPLFAGREIVTVEGLARDGALHPAQACMVRHYGSQCGYCTPGIVMSLFEGCHREGMGGAGKIADQLCGNLCRCTGYRPIHDAASELFARRWEDVFSARLAEAADEPAGTHCGAMLRPCSLAELLEVRAKFPEALLVAGATEIGVEVTKKFRRLPALISLDAVAELRACTAAESAWSLGASAPLTQIEEALAGEFPIIDEMLRLFASRQIRNRATLGGNLVTASPIGDSAPVLLALGASVVLASREGGRTVPLDEFFTGYRRTQLGPGEILQAVIVPRLPANARARFLKVSKRRELDISIVSAAFCIVEDAGGIVTSARLAFGGVAATPVLARAAGEALIGRKLDAEAVETVAGILENAFEPISDARGGAEFRAALVPSLWRKFCAGGQAPPPGDARPERTAAVLDASRARPHESAIGHVTGRAQYVDDAARRRGMLTLWPVCAPHAHARIVRIDAARAESMPGVAAVLTARDVPGVNDVGCSRPDEILLADEVVCFHGQMVAVIVGESEDACRAAAAAVVAEYEPLAPVLTIRDAIAKESFHTEPNAMRRGDADAAIAAATRRIEGEIELGGQEHFYLETQAAWAETTDDGGVFVSSSTQHPTEIQIVVARVLGLPRNAVVVEAPRMGGGFGGKETQGNSWAALAALAAWRTGRPTRVQLDRDLDMQLNGKRHPFYARFAAGFDDDGRLRGVKVELVSNGGWSLDLSMPIMDRALFHLDNAYYIPAADFSGRVAKTNVASNTAFRGFGGPQGMLVIEEILDRIARALGLPPELVRERNLYHGAGETNTTHYGQEIGDNRVGEMWFALKESAAFDERRGELARWNARSPMVKRGLAMTPVKFGISFTYTPYNQAGALVLVCADGTVQVNHGGTEMGQGLHTKVLGVAMRELGLPAERIRVMATRTDKVPNTSATAASSGADLNGAAVRDACRKLTERMRPVAAAMLGAPADAAMRIEDGQVWFEGDASRRLPFPELCNEMHMSRVSLAATGFYKTPGIHWDRATGKGRPFYYFACGVAASEVEVDGWTGMSRVRRVDILHDAGESLNPGVDRGQIEGGFVQGMGWLTGEELLWDGEGRLLTHSASTYAIPSFGDSPEDFRVTLLPAAAQEGVIHGSKAVGEPPLMLAISVREAIRDALGAFGRPGGPVALASPATCEAVFHAVRMRPAEG